jgi:hypothetical protein
VAENINPLRQRFEKDSVRAALYLNGLDGLKGLSIPHHDGTAAAKAVLGLGIDGDTSRSGVGNDPSRVKGVEVKDQDLAAPGNIEPSVIVVRINILRSHLVRLHTWKAV